MKLFTLKLLFFTGSLLLSMPIFSKNQLTQANDNENCSMLVTATPDGAYCGEETGDIRVQISGGTAPYDLEWDNGDMSIWGKRKVGDGTHIINNMPSGKYEIRVRDKKGCRNKQYVHIDVNASDLTYTIEPSDPCGSVGNMIIRIQNSSPPYWVIIDGPTSGAVIAETNAFRIDNLSPGDYKVTVDKNGCGHTQYTSLLYNPNTLALSVKEITANSGQAAVQTEITGGHPNYVIHWAGAASGYTHSTGSKSITHLNPGKYYFQVRDDIGCMVRESIEIGGGNARVGVTSETLLATTESLKKAESNNSGETNIRDFTSLTAIVKDFEVSQNYPNPFNTNTTININLPEAMPVAIRVYDLYGKVIIDDKQTLVQGKNEYIINSDKFSSGVYFYSIQAGTHRTTKRMQVIR